MSSRASQNKSPKGKMGAENAIKEDLDFLKQQSRKLAAQQRANIGGAVNKMDLPPEDKKKLKNFSYGLLHPSGPMDIPRPVPARSHKAFHTGQLILDTAADAISVEVSPDPFHFATVTTEVVAGRESFPLVTQDNSDLNPLDIGDEYSPDLNYNGTFCYALPIKFEGNTWKQPTIRTQTDANPNWNLIAPREQRFHFRTGAGYDNVTLPSQLTQWTLNHSCGATLVCDLVAGKLHSDGSIIIEATSTGHVVPPNTYVDVSLNLIAPIVVDTINGGDLLFFGVRVSEVQNVRFPWDSLQFTIRQMQILTSAGSINSYAYSIGEAVYPTDGFKAAQLNALYSESFLWAPVACSTIVNVTQVLKDRGGNFLSAYLPSNVVIPPGPNEAWPVIKGYGRSYPVASNPFAKGAQATWVGARIQDYEFRRPFDQPFWLDAQKKALPSTVIIAQRALSDTPSTARFYIDFNVAFVVQTLDPKIEMTMERACPSFCMLFLSIVAMNPFLVGENPDHLNRLLEIVKQVITDPRVIQLAKLGLTKGLPMLLGAAL